jgi:hypothetical protein
MADTGRMVPGQLQRMELVIVEGAQIDAFLVTAAFGEAIDTREEVEALLEPVRIHLDMAEMRDIKTGLAGCHWRASLSNRTDRPGHPNTEMRSWRIGLLFGKYRYMDERGGVQ